MDSRRRGNDRCKGKVHLCTVDAWCMNAPYTVATGVAGEPIAPGNLNGGAVSKKRLR
jgi:hypothetical protein